jgi:hypothetical protein
MLSNRCAALGLCVVGLLTLCEVLVLIMMETVAAPVLTPALYLTML